ncbi:unnamed protein product [Ostreobium quekettii]|uniref:Uncharacterized protein n=1 Tax=Ostreobium quekettii TaxID=121088 RepID=A0A8S1IVC3_9CHLO|nr:unnamed protein product [Ostreobium quekettii]|eukprot:evm.model.scf_494EXC.1 EVM.evm.TU.scf_494EXC.1   scf_494EXC:30790-31314(-)
MIVDQCFASGLVCSQCAARGRLRAVGGQASHQVPNAGLPEFVLVTRRVASRTVPSTSSSTPVGHRYTPHTALQGQTCCVAAQCPDSQPPCGCVLLSVCRATGACCGTHPHFLCSTLPPLPLGAQSGFWSDRLATPCLKAVCSDCSFLHTDGDVDLEIKIRDSRTLRCNTIGGSS